MVSFDPKTKGVAFSLKKYGEHNKMHHHASPHCLS